MKKLKNIIISLLLVVVMMLPLCFTGCNPNNDQENTKQEQTGDNSQQEENNGQQNNGDNNNPQTIVISEPKVVMAEVSGQLDIVKNKMAASASDEISENEAETVSSAIRSVADKNETKWEEQGANSYISANKWPMGMVYAVDFIVRNATIANGYSNSFQYGQIYTGQAEVSGYNGYSSLIINTDDESNQVIVNMDYDSIDQQVSYAVDIYVDYDFSTDTAKKLTVLYAENKYFTDVCYAEYDFINNNFKNIHIDAYTNEARALKVAHFEEFVSSYNSGTLTIAQIAEFGVTSLNLISGNITEDRNKLNIYSYEAYKYPVIGNIESNTWINVLYNSLYNDAKTYTLRKEKLDTLNTKVVTYTKDAVNYGFAKSECYTGVYDNKEIYAYTFIEYEDMIKYLSDIKTLIIQDQSASDYVKDVIASAYGYVYSRGETGYTMQLGAYDGITTTLTKSGANYSRNGITISYIIYCKAISTYITFEKDGATVKNVLYGTFTNKIVKDNCLKVIDSEYVSADKKDFAQGLINYCNTKPENKYFENSENYYIGHIGITTYPEWDGEKITYVPSLYCEIFSNIEAEVGSSYYISIYVSENIHGSVWTIENRIIQYNTNI
ncbi:MAG: hypothetical protein IJS74_01850 [Clostridia bacterium]|nr:hypothetical protein [Clostridia bacterium]